MSRTMQSLVVLFGGRDREASIFALHAAGHRIRAIVVPEKPAPRLSASTRKLEDAGLPVVFTGRADLANVLGPFEGSLLLSIGFPFLLKQEHLALFPLCLNVHPTLLPRYRGPTSGAHILMNNETESGATVHLIDEGMDTGPIVLQRRVALSRFDTIRSLMRKVYAIEPELICEAIERVSSPEFRPEPQAEQLASCYPHVRTPNDSRIDPERSLTELFDAIRACDPEDYPAHFYLEGQKVCIRLWRPERPEADGPDMI